MPSFTRTAGTRRAQSAPATAPTSTRPPDLLILGRYRLHGPLGTGGFGTVWLARDERLERDVAVKVLAREQILGGRFEREARAAARLSHAGIVTLYEAAVDDHGAYLVSELVRGRTLSELLAAGRLSDRDIVEIGAVVCDALGHAHAQGVIHRDVKPSNVLVPEAPGAPGQLAKLTDFGVARLIGADRLTRAGDVVGTAAYMAPEQADGGDADAAADLYSLALVLYEALTGVNPAGFGAARSSARRLGARLPPMHRQRRDLPPRLGQAIDRALMPRPADRGTIQELRAELLGALGQVEDRPGVVLAPWPRHDPAPDPGHRDFDPLEESEPVRRRTWSGRCLAGVSAGLVAGWLANDLPGSAPLRGVAAGAAACLLVAALPRLGWLASTVGLGAVLATERRAGEAIVVVLAALVPILALPRQRMTWPLAAAAAGLSLIGLGGAWPAVAARATRAWSRAALGAIGWIWILATGALIGHGVYTRLPAGLPPGWSESAARTADQLLPRLFAPGLMAPALLWALGAIVLPWITRRGSATQIVMVSAWSAGLASGTVTLLRLLHAGAQAQTGMVVLGAVAGAIVALAPLVIRSRGVAPQSTDTAAGLA